MLKASIQKAGTIIKYLITPLLFSIYPAIFRYSHNIDSLSLAQLKTPLLLAVFSTVLVFIICKLALKDNIKASLGATGFLIIFWLYGLLYYGITYFIDLDHWQVMSLLLFLYVLSICFIILLHKKFSLENVNKVLFSMISVVLVFNLISIIPAEVTKYQIAAQESKYKQLPSKKSASEDYPDIYYIILDEYARFDTVKEEWGYDNSAFKKFLKEKGFFIAEGSRVRTPKTTHFMPSILNVEYKTGKHSELLQKYHDNWLFNYLHRKGYKITFLDGWQPCARHEWEFENFVYKSIYDTEVDYGNMLIERFTYLNLERSLLKPVIHRLLGGEASNLWYHGNKFFFNYIGNYPSVAEETEKPIFLFAHIMCPHLPYVFDQNGNFLDNPTNYWEYESVSQATRKSLYLEQFIYVTERITKAVNNILKTSETEPVIILTSDHGPRLSAGIEKEKQHHRVLNAVYFPGGDYTDLYDNIAPVNTLRVALNQYFDKNFKMLEDK